MDSCVPQNASMRKWTQNEAPCLESLLEFQLQTSSGTCTYDPSLKILEKWSFPCTAAEYDWFFLLCTIFTRVTPDQKCSIVAVSGMEIPNVHFPALTELKSGHLGNELRSTQKSFIRVNITSHFKENIQTSYIPQFHKTHVHWLKSLSFPAYCRRKFH